MTKIITVPQLAEPTRLDKFLVRELGLHWSRTAIQQAIKKGRIKVDEKKVMVHHFLKKSEIITVPELANNEIPPAKISPNPSILFKVVAETPDFIVVDKPTGLVVHPAQGLHESTLADGLVAYYPDLANVGEDPLRPGIVHRLDREASGLMVVARTPAMFSYLKKEFQEHKVHKQYQALVVGQVSQPSGTINFPLARSKSKSGKTAARPQEAEDTKSAITHYDVLKRFQQTTLLNVTIATGRTHQIRAHLQALGYPLVGDKLYSHKKINFKGTPGRLFLHATQLSFTDKEGIKHTFTSPLPTELQNFLNTLS
ncbi:MAG: RluA family pseudouridine synthase [Candidatus Kerfeldbacteria bacterium]|nr:RluA family pseudouridine synthase [Candidatus Kerfeldbacteria bacterium]